MVKCGERLGIVANRTKTERNNRIVELWESGWRQKSIANMLKMKESAVSMVLLRARRKRETLSP